MNNGIETKEHVVYWINETIKELDRDRLELTDNALYSSNEIDDNLINDMYRSFKEIIKNNFGKNPTQILMFKYDKIF